MIIELLSMDTSEPSSIAQTPTGLTLIFLLDFLIFWGVRRGVVLKFWDSMLVYSTYSDIPA